MKKALLSLFALLTALTSANAQTVDFQWGTATWNIEDGRVYEDLDDLNLEGIVLTYPNPTSYQLTFFNMVAVSYDLYIDNATEPIHADASARMNTAVRFDYQWVEGHSYRIVTTGAVLAQANLATYKTDTLSQVSDSYTISFTIKGPELVKTIDVEATMALSITDQYHPLTFSLLNSQDIAGALGISSVYDEATIYGLNVNGSYNPNFIDPFDGWRDADGEYTVWGGNAYEQLGHNAYPAVYCIKLNETADTVSYFFYDYWKEYDPNEPDSIGGSGISSAPRRVPETSYNSVIWDWENEDGTTTQYRRSYRVNEGEDYKASFAILANKKMVRVNATLHFVSQEEYEKAGQYDIDGDGKVTPADITRLIELYLSNKK